MRGIVSAGLIVAALGAFAAAGPKAAAAQASSSADQTHAHTGGQPHASPDAIGGAASDEGVHYVTLNVAISDEGIEPSSVFIPAGRPVQLVLRNRGTTEHHYRVAGLAPEDLVWIARGGSSGDPSAASDGHDHHDRQFVRSRTASPAGITPTGTEVHAYVSGASNLDVVLFTATQTGSFVVLCDLHPQKTGKLVVFEAASQPAALVAAPGNALSLARGDALSLALSRDLGRVDHTGMSSVLVEATYAPAGYETRVLGGPSPMAPLEPDQYVAILLSETIHKGNMPGLAEPPGLSVGGSRLPLIDWKVVTDLPHHRATFYRFERGEAFGAEDQVMTLRLASGQEAVWQLSSPITWSWFTLVVVAGGVGSFAWLVWTMAFGGARRSNRLNPVN